MRPTSVDITDIHHTTPLATYVKSDIHHTTPLATYVESDGTVHSAPESTESKTN